MEIDAPKTWLAIPDLLTREKGKVLVLGATDTGKSTLTKFLISHLCQQGSKVALIDSDIGQSSLGPPATIGFSLFKSHPDWGIILSTPEIFFVGSTTPEEHVSIFLTESRKCWIRRCPQGVTLSCSIRPVLFQERRGKS